MALNPETHQIEKLTEAFGELLRPDGSKVPKHWTVFREGELVEVKGSTFKVAYLNESCVVLEPVSPVIPTQPKEASP
jgi:hypothetical protein